MGQTPERRGPTGLHTQRGVGLRAGPQSAGHMLSDWSQTDLCCNYTSVTYRKFLNPVVFSLLQDL